MDANDAFEVAHPHHAPEGTPAKERETFEGAAGLQLLFKLTVQLLARDLALSDQPEGRDFLLKKQCGWQSRYNN